MENPLNLWKEYTNLGALQKPQEVPPQKEGNPNPGPNRRLKRK